MSEQPSAPHDQEESTQARAGAVCKAAMLGDQQALLRILDEQPELVNHADEQVSTILRCPSLLRSPGPLRIEARLAERVCTTAGPLPVALGGPQQPHWGGGAVASGALNLCGCLLRMPSSTGGCSHRPPDALHTNVHSVRMDKSATHGDSSSAGVDLQRGAKVRAVNPEGTTALHWAVFRNALPCIEALLRAGAEKDAKDSNGYMVRAAQAAPCACTTSSDQPT